MAALPYNDVNFTWTHTGENGTTSQVIAGHIVEDEIISSNITLLDMDRFSYGNRNCTGTNSIGMGKPRTFMILQRGELLSITICHVHNSKENVSENKLTHNSVVLF